MPKQLKLRRNFPYSDFNVWITSSTKQSFNDFMKMNTCNVTLKTEITSNKNSKNMLTVVDKDKMTNSEEIIPEEKHELRNQILHNDREYNSTELEICTNFEISNCADVNKNPQEKNFFHTTSEVHMQDKNVTLNTVVPIIATTSQVCDELFCNANKERPSCEWNFKNDFVLQQSDPNFSVLDNKYSSFAVSSIKEKEEKENKCIKDTLLSGKLIDTSEISPEQCNVEVKSSSSNDQNEAQYLLKENGNVFENNYTNLSVIDATGNKIQQKTVEFEKLCTKPKSEAISPEKNSFYKISEKVHMQEINDKYVALNTVVPIIATSSQVCEELSCTVSKERPSYEWNFKNDCVLQQSDPNINVLENKYSSSAVPSVKEKEEKENKSIKDTLLLGNLIDTSEISPEQCNLEVKSSSSNDQNEAQSLLKENGNVFENNYTNLSVIDATGNKIRQKAAEFEKLCTGPKSETISPKKNSFHKTSEKVHMLEKNDKYVALNTVVPIIATSSQVCAELSCTLNNKDRSSYECNLKNDCVFQQSDPNFNILNTDNLNCAAVQTVKEEKENTSIKNTSLFEKMIDISKISSKPHNVEVKLSSTKHKSELQPQLKGNVGVFFNNYTGLNVGHAIDNKIHQNKTVESKKLCVESKTIPQKINFHTSEKAHMQDKDDTSSTLHKIVPINISASQISDKLSCNPNKEKPSYECNLESNHVQDSNPNFNMLNIEIKSSCSAASAVEYTKHKFLNTFYEVLSSEDSCSSESFGAKEVCGTSVEKLTFQCRLAKSVESVPQNKSQVIGSTDSGICNDKCSNSNPVCVIRNNVSEKLFTTIVPTVDKLFSETNNAKNSKSKIDDSCEITVENFPTTSLADTIPSQAHADNCSDSTQDRELKYKVEKSLNEMSSSVSAVCSNLDLTSETEAKAHEASSSQNKTQYFDFYPLEKSDIEDPEWENVKKLKSNEERYKQVRKCWETKKIPNPNKNLTYHSYRKQKLKAGKLDDRLIKQHKRHASEKNVHPPAKRTRKCTYTVDNRIHSIKSKQDSQTKLLRNEMNAEINILDCNFNYEVSELEKHYNYYQFNFWGSRNQFMRDRNLLGIEYDRNLYDITNKYNRKIDLVTSQYRSKIDALNKAQQEILTFCNFYEGLREDNPTVLTGAQLQEIEEIEDLYEQLKKYYN